MSVRYQVHDRPWPNDRVTIGDRRIKRCRSWRLTETSFAWDPDVVVMSRVDCGRELGHYGDHSVYDVSSRHFDSGYRWAPESLSVAWCNRTLAEAEAVSE